MSEPRPILLIDTYSLFFRAQYALPPMNTTTGEPTSALYGFSAVLIKLLRDHSPDGLAFAIDAPAQTFRKARYEGYKAKRDGPPDVLIKQLNRLDQLIRALDVPAFCVPGFEADDLLATLATELERDEKAVLIVTGDRDMLQLVGGSTRVEFVGRRGQPGVIYDAEAVKKRFGVDPSQLPSYMALVGDNSDNLVGVPGIGPRIAADLIGRFGSAGELLDRLDQVEPARIRESLRAHHERIALNADLARLRRDVPLEPGPRSGKVEPEAFERLGKLFEELEFKSLIPRLAALGGG